MRVAIIPDTHIPHHDEEAVSCADKMIAFYKPDLVVFLGDFMDYGPISRHNVDSVAGKAEMSLARDFEIGNRVFDRFTRHCQNVVYLEGNHEDWAYQYLDKNPEMKGLVEVDRGLHFKDRRAEGYKIKHLRYNEVYRTGHLHYTHGWYTNQHHAQKHLQSYQCSMVYGHLHDHQVATYISPTYKPVKHMAMCLGCLCNKNPEYMRRSPNKWVHMMGFAEIRKNGDFNLHPIVISRGVASFMGKEFNA